MALLTLEDGSKFEGKAFGADKSVSGEVVFTTGMVGYPESLTDPSFQGQILVFTYPLIGNYGVSGKKDEFGFPTHLESEKIRVAGVIVHELCENPSHWASTKTLDEWLKEWDVPGIHGIDTRALTQKLRERGVMLGYLDHFGNSDPVFEDPNKRNLVAEVSTKKITEYGSGDKKVVLIDCGTKYGIIRSLLKRNLKVIRVPYDTTAEKILQFQPNGLMISNGPGDPKTCTQTISTVRNLFDKLPIFGVCLGNQILALAAGADTYKLKYGHRGQNKPCIDLGTGRCYITSQNHGYAVDSESLPDSWEVSWKNADDGTVEGIHCKNKPVFGTQWHPEHSPGPMDTNFIFDEFVKLLK